MSLAFARRALRSANYFLPLAAAALLLAMAQPEARDARHFLARIAGLDTLRGTPLDDVLRGTERNDLLDGAGGDDRLVGLGGDDVLSGGLGRDWLDGGPGNDVLEGADGDDIMDGGDGMDWLFGDKGDDLLRGGAGLDKIEGGDGKDFLDGGIDDDVLAGGIGDDILLGGAGNDQLDGGPGADHLDGGDGNDILDGGDEDGLDILLGGPGIDTLYAGDNGSSLDGGIGNDALFGDDGNDNINGGAGDDALAGNDGDDKLDGGAGNDVLNGAEGNDLLLGGAGLDTLLGGENNDRLSGGAGNDLLRGDDGDDLLDGDAQFDFLIGGRGTDVINGGTQNDVILLRAGDVDSARVELIDGGTNPGALVEADSLLLSGFTLADVRRIQTASGERIEIVDPITHGTYIVTRVEKIVFLQVVAHVAGARESTLQLVNASSVELSAILKFVGANGQPLSATVAGDSAEPTHEVKLPSRGSAEMSIRPAASGAIWIYTDQPLNAFLRTALPDQSIGVFPAEPLSDAFAIPVVLDRSRGLSSGFAVTNNGVTTAMNVWLHNATGAEVEATFVDIASQGQVIRFINDLFPRYDGFVGKAIIQGGPLAGAALLVDSGRVSVSPTLLTTSANIGVLRVAHVVSGGNSSTTIRIFRLGIARDTVLNGRVLFFDNEGRPLAIDVVGQGRVTEASFGFAPTNGSTVITTSGSGPLVEGSAVITTERGGVVVTSGVRIAGSRSVESHASRGQSGFVAAVRRNEAEQLSTIVALGGEETAVTVDLVLRGPDGQRIDGGDARVSLPIYGHLAQPIERIFPRAMLANFRGSVEARASGGTIAVTVFELGRGSASAIPTTIFP